MPTRTPVQIQKFVDEIQYRMDLPQQFFGDEPNAYRKDWDSAKVRSLITAAWPYEAAAGNQSIPSVYKAINLGESFLCDRWYLPATQRDLKMFENKGYPIFGIESKHQLKDFDIVMTSIAYPILAISFYHYLKMSDIPLRWRDRDVQGLEKFPFVMVGGQSYGAPECLAPVFDAVWCGEVEDEPGNPGIRAVFDRIETFMDVGLWSTDRLRCYELLALEFNFLYFPRFIDVDYEYEDRQLVGLEQPSKQVTNYHSNLPGMTVPILKRIVKDMDAVPPLDNAPLLYVDPGMGAGDIEVGRGCPAWCSFCALTYRQKPYRQRSVPYMVEFGKEQMKNSGGVNLVPFMPDFPMHSQRKRLVGTLLEQVTDEVEGGAMRVDDFIADPDYILLQVHGGMDGVTLGVEGNSQRMRDLVGKGCADEDIKEAVARGIRAGIRKFKFFMISNLPGEDEGDVFRILKLAKDLADIRDSMNQPSVRMQFSWTPLLIEANTPFQWFAPPTSTRALGDVWEEFRDLKIDFKLGGKAEVNKATYFQLCQRASREVGEVLVDASEAMGTACWGGIPKTMKEELQKRLIDAGFLNGLDDCFDERFKHDMFGWEFIDQGVNPELLWVTYLQMREFVEQTDSHTYDLNFEDDYHGNEWVERCDTRCYGKTCGVCDVEDLQIRRGYIQDAKSEQDYDLHTIKVVDQKSMVVKLRMKLEKDESKRFIMNDHWRYAFRRACFQSEVPITKRSVRFASDGIKFKDWTCGIDYLEVGLTKPATPAMVAEYVRLINEKLNGLQILECEMHPAASDSLRTDVDLSLFELETEDTGPSLLQAIARWNAADYVKMTLRQDGGYFAPERQEVNAKELCDDIWVVRQDHHLLLRMLVRGKASPYDVYTALTGKKSSIDAMKYPARRLEAFIDYDESAPDMFRPNSVLSGSAIPVNPLDQPFHPMYTPRELDEAEGRLVAV